MINRHDELLNAETESQPAIVDSGHDDAHKDLIEFSLDKSVPTIGTIATITTTATATLA